MTRDEAEAKHGKPLTDEEWAAQCRENALAGHDNPEIAERMARQDARVIARRGGDPTYFRRRANRLRRRNLRMRLAPARVRINLARPPGRREHRPRRVRSGSSSSGGGGGGPGEPEGEGDDDSPLARLRRHLADRRDPWRLREAPLGLWRLRVAYCRLREGIEGPEG